MLIAVSVAVGATSGYALMAKRNANTITDVHSSTDDSTNTNRESTPTLGCNLSPSEFIAATSPKQMVSSVRLSDRSSYQSEPRDSSIFILEEDPRQSSIDLQRDSRMSENTLSWWTAAENSTDSYVSAKDPHHIQINSTISRMSTHTKGNIELQETRSSFTSGSSIEDSGGYSL